MFDPVHLAALALTGWVILLPDDRHPGLGSPAGAVVILSDDPPHSLMAAAPGRH